MHSPERNQLPLPQQCWGGQTRAHMIGCTGFLLSFKAPHTLSPSSWQKSCKMFICDYVNKHVWGTCCIQT